MEKIWKNSNHWYYSHFPESQFLCVKEKKKEYIDRVILGHSIANKSKALICGIVRNAEDTIEYCLNRIERLGSLFEDYQVFLYENDSIDDTKHILTDKYYNPKVEIQSENINSPPFNDDKGLNRRQYMAIARNKYLNYAREYSKTNDFHFLIILDPDIVGGWSYHGVLNSIGHSRWDVIGSNSLFYEKDKETKRPRRLFYDIWAFREKGTFDEIDSEQGNLLRFNRGENLVPVNSCFGGLAIYKPYLLFDDINYTEEDCDHVTFHKGLINLGYRIFLNPSQITLYNKNEYMYDSE